MKYKSYVSKTQKCHTLSITLYNFFFLIDDSTQKPKQTILYECVMFVRHVNEKKLSVLIFCLMFQDTYTTLCYYNIHK